MADLAFSVPPPIILSNNKKGVYAMRKNLGAKPYIVPQPVFVIGSYGENNIPNAMIAVWGGISNETEITICLSNKRKTADNIIARKAFTVSLADAEHIVSCDFVGITTGKKLPDKFSQAGFHATKSEFVDAPLIEELPVALECRVKSYDPATWRLIGEIVNISVDERVLDEKGHVSLAKFSPVAYDWMTRSYLRLGEKVADAYRTGLALKK